jgi:hypothetical protein
VDNTHEVAQRVAWHIQDDGQARAIIDRLMGAVPAGSYLAVARPTLEGTGEKMAAAIAYGNDHGTPPGTHRSPEQIERLVDGLELVEPLGGVVLAVASGGLAVR